MAVGACSRAHAVRPAMARPEQWRARGRSAARRGRPRAHTRARQRRHARRRPAPRALRRAARARARAFSLKAFAWSCAACPMDESITKTMSSGSVAAAICSISSKRAPSCRCRPDVSTMMISYPCAAEPRARGRTGRSSRGGARRQAAERPSGAGRGRGRMRPARRPVAWERRGWSARWLSHASGGEGAAAQPCPCSAGAAPTPAESCRALRARCSCSRPAAPSQRTRSARAASAHLLLELGDAVARDDRGVGLRVRAVERDLRLRRVLLELVEGARAEGVCAHEARAPPLALVHVRVLGARGGLARALRAREGRRAGRPAQRPSALNRRRALDAAARQRVSARAARRCARARSPAGRQT